MSSLGSNQYAASYGISKSPDFTSRKKKSQFKGMNLFESPAQRLRANQQNEPTFEQVPKSNEQKGATLPDGLQK